MRRYDELRKIFERREYFKIVCGMEFIVNA